MNAMYLHLEELKKAYLHDANPSLKVRQERIERIVKMVTQYEENLCKVIDADFGHRSSIETRLAELNVVKQAAKHTLKHLEDWMKPVKVDVPFHLRPSKAWIQAQAKGVIGIISPWNYPIQLALVPAIAAFAAGNRVWLKPSERSPRTSGYLATLIAEFFHPLEFSVTTGDSLVARDFSSLPFDHLFFTGSSSVGRMVMRSAADNLTPVTLELGGKSPAIINKDAHLTDAAKRIIYGKLLNCGQTCIAPDYVLIEEHLIPDLQTALSKAAQEMFGNPSDLSHPIDEKQLERWSQLIANAQSQGAQITPLLQEGSHPFTPVTLTNIPEGCAVLEEEIFGPILPIIGVQSNEDMISYIQERDRPLAMYWFGKDKKVLEHFLSQTHAGGVCINDTLLQISIEDLPFGGIGNSGLGAYHGKSGFDSFSHLKPVLQVKGRFGIRKWMGTALAHPPYGKTIERLIRWLS
jgi:coniferyl-aldehyde dehydrogenase